MGSKYVNVNIKADFKSNDNYKLTVKFNTFETPKKIKSGRLYICVDHNFEIKDYFDGIIFIDHHYMETLGEKYSSNSLMMFDNYDEIQIELGNIIKEKQIKDIEIFAHCDLDGLASALILKAMLLGQNKDGLEILKLLGEIGDISDNAEKWVKGIVPDRDSETYFKKMKSWSSCFGKFMKAIRAPLLDFYINDNIGSEIINSYNGKFDSVNSAFIQTMDFVDKYIYRPIENMDSINLQSVLMYMNNISQHHLFEKILEVYKKESDRLTKNFIDPDNVPANEMTVIFKSELKHNRNTKYKLLVINSPFDLGRSVMWKYKSDFVRMCKKGIDKNTWHFKITDYLEPKDIIGIVSKNDETILDRKNVLCYNTVIKKVSMDGDYAFDICNESFEGGGHCSDGKSEHSLGSAFVEHNDFINSFIVESVH